jgi:TonB family protein
VLTSIWLAGVAINLVVLLVGFARLSWLTRQCRPVDDPRWLAAADAVSRAQGLRRPVSLLQSHHPTLLVTWGFSQPKVILPAASGDWPGDRIRVVLSHELAHVRRGDWVVQIVAELLRSAYWFNPLVWIACIRLRQESEQACDDEVLSLGVDGPEYATHLLDVAHAMRHNRRLWSPALAMARPSSLERRISAMLNARLTRTPISRTRRIAVAAALLAITLPVAGLTLFAQTRFATISGSIADETGGLLRNVVLVLSNVQTQTKQEVRSNVGGVFEFVGVPAGDYQLEARLPGFETFRTSVAVGVGAAVQQNIRLQIGSVEESITVHDAPPPLPPPPPPPGEPGAVHHSRPRRSIGTCADQGIGGCIAPPFKVKDVRPLYPPNLRGANVEGPVLLDGRIGTDGRMKDLRVVSSPHPDLERAALDAVSEWEFAPTMLNGRTVETRIGITVRFQPGH